jgi:ectoine hydroxylase-related dioxygenase (phytanoyl-CoA dioxygenase family)
VFVPLVDIDESTGGTEMKRGSHVRSKGGGEAARFEAYEHLESVTHLVAAGTPVVMDYRVWHRGLANSSADTIRPLLYFKYALRPSSANSTGKRAPAGDGGGGKKRKRIALVPVPV